MTIKSSIVFYIYVNLNFYIFVFFIFYLIFLFVNKVYGIIGQSTCPRAFLQQLARVRNPSDNENYYILNSEFKYNEAPDFFPFFFFFFFFIPAFFRALFRALF